MGNIVAEFSIFNLKKIRKELVQAYKMSNQRLVKDRLERSIGEIDLTLGTLKQHTGKIIKFGYGNLIVRSVSDMLVIEKIRGKKELGPYRGEMYKKTDVCDAVRFEYGKDMGMLLNELENVTKERSKVYFRGYTFDFGNYQPTSVEVLKNGIEGVIREYISLSAI